MTYLEKYKTYGNKIKEFWFEIKTNMKNGINDILEDSKMEITTPIQQLKREKELDDLYLDKNKYGNIFRNSKYIFHGTSKEDISYINSILKNGILTQKSLKEKNIRDKQNIGYNGDEYVSISLPPSDIISYSSDDGTFSSFRAYTLKDNNIGFLIEKEGLKITDKGNGTKGTSECYDEKFIEGDIPIKNIKGLIIDEKLLSENIKNIYGNYEKGVFLFQKLKEEYGVKIYNKKGFEINI